MRRYAVGLLLLLAGAAAAQQNPVSPVGTPTTSAVNVQVDPAHPIKVDVGSATITGTFVTGTFESSCRATAAAPSWGETTSNQLSCDLAGNLRTSGASGGGGSSDVALHDNTTPANHLGVNGSGQAAIQNPSNLDAALSTRATEATLAAIKAKTDNLDVLLSTRTKPADTQPVSAVALPLPAGAATAAAQTDGTQKAIARGGAKARPRRRI
jgi:hypothetical protein